jgi:hypothetical protein
MNHTEAASPLLTTPGRRRARLRGRPSGLKGRYRDRCAAGLRPALDPGASAAPDHAALTGRRMALPARRAAPTTTNQDQIPTTQSLRFQGIAGIRLNTDYAEVCVKPRVGGEGLRWWGLLVDFSA